MEGLGTIDNLNGLLTLLPSVSTRNSLEVGSDRQPKWFTHDEQNC